MGKFHWSFTHSENIAEYLKGRRQRVLPAVKLSVPKDGSCSVPGGRGPGWLAGGGS